MNVKMSQRLAVVVKVGAMPLGHLTLVNVPVKPPEPVLAIRMNDWPVTAVGIVNVQLPVMVTVWAVPVDRDSVWAVPEFPIPTTPSVYWPDNVRPGAATPVVPLIVVAIVVYS
jgi:hypothetical protein